MKYRTDFIKLCTFVSGVYTDDFGWDGNGLWSNVWFTRSQVASMLNCSLTTSKNKIQYWVNCGLLVENYDMSFGRMGRYEYCLSIQGVEYFKELRAEGVR